MLRFRLRRILRNGLMVVIKPDCRRISGKLPKVKWNEISPHSRIVLYQSSKIWRTQVRYFADLPPHTRINLPALSPTMEQGNILKWLKKEGDKINEGDVLCEIETDKATMSFEASDRGYLAKILVPEGAKGIPVGRLLCIVVEDQSHVAAFKDFKDDSPAAPAVPAAAPAPATAAPTPAPATAPLSAPAAAVPAPAPGGRVYASPFARRLAELKRIRLGGQGSGLYGSLKSVDLSGAPAQAVAPSTATAAPTVAPATSPGQLYVDIPLTGMRNAIAKRLTASKQTIPHFQLSVTVNVDKVVKMRQQVNKRIEKTKQRVSVNDFIVKAVASACKRVPAVNVYWMDTFIRQFSQVDICIAVSTPTGLLTPIVFNAESRGLLDINKAIKELAEKAREGKLQPNEFQGGTVTVSNLGMYGITSFNAIINPPQSLILACGGVQEMVVPDRNSFRAGKFITLTASMDHRTVDGAVGAQWMKALKENLEDPAQMIL